MTTTNFQLKHLPAPRIGETVHEFYPNKYKEDGVFDLSEISQS